MPEIGYHETFDKDGNVIESIPFEVSDDELLMRELEKEANDYHNKALQAFKNWDKLTTQEKSKIVKFLLGFYLVAGQSLGLFNIGAKE